MKAEGAFFRENIESSKVYEKWKSNSEFMKLHNIYDKFWSSSVELFIEHLLWNWEECIHSD